MAVGLMACVMPGAVQAGLYQDDLSRCIVASTTGPDRDLLLRWIFVAMASNPKIADMARVKAGQGEALSREAAGLTQRLLLGDCRKQTVDAVKYEGPAAIQQAFSLLGQVAMMDLMRDPAVTAYTSSMDQYLDKEKMEALRQEMGVKSATPPAPKP